MCTFAFLLGSLSTIIACIHYISFQIWDPNRLRCWPCDWWAVELFLDILRTEQVSSMAAVACLETPTVPEKANPAQSASRSVKAGGRSIES